MASSLNRVTLIGNLGNDPEVRYMANGDAVANISIATTESWKDKDGQRHEKTEWHRVTFYRKLAEIVGEYLKKGSSIWLEGRLETRKWEDKSGVERQTTEIIAKDMKMLGSKPKDEGDRYEKLEKEHLGDIDKGTGVYSKQAKTGGEFDDMTDDIPF